ncbi:hypothetical protein CL647_04890 [bacterium]|nr:hypothetical protein [bacterium]|tara:strand:+ start:14165 stop:15169 length:1005 start_codon:yes stop_codon:yes gene_type:complete
MNKLLMFSLIKKDLDCVKQTLKDVLLSRENSDSSPVIRHLLSSQGKLLRPTLVFLSTYLVKPDLDKQSHRKLVLCATAIELIHMASLVHDDVIDDADLRRDSESVKSKFGNPVAVTIGVYLYSVALQLISDVGSIRILNELSVTVQKMCEGELLQYSYRDKQSFDLESYYSVLESKTAVLFKMACLVGAYLFDFSQEQQDSLASYAIELGYSFQLSDDYLDMFGSNNDLKKSIGQDFIQGQFTLPMISTLEKVSETEKEHIIQGFRNKDLASFNLLRDKAVTYSVHDDLASLINQKIDQSKQSLSLFKDSNYKKSLFFIADYVLSRVRSEEAAI